LEGVEVAVDVPRRSDLIEPRRKEV
jgi:hypothetical protein